MNDLEKALSIISSSSYEISDTEKFASIYFYLNSIKKKAEELEKIVKKRGQEMMYDMDIKKLDFGSYEISKIDSTETEEYSASSIIKGLGVEKALPFLKVDSKITDYLKRTTAEGVMTIDEANVCREGITKKFKTGYLKITRKKK